MSKVILITGASSGMGYQTAEALACQGHKVYGAARRVMTYHNSKFSLANHAWTEPMELIYRNSEGKNWTLLTPRIGEVVTLDCPQEFMQWWR